MSGTVHVIGLGPGPDTQVTPEARAAVEAASHFFGYTPYIARLDLRADQVAVASDNRQELDRARAALEMASAGKTVAVVSGGDPGVFAMASAVCEAIDTGPEDWKGIALNIVPGITAMLALAAKVGAPLGTDFCTISLSDNLKPWSIIEKRLSLAAQAEFAMALYNPISRTRPWQLGRALDILRTILPGDTMVVVGTSVGRESENIVITTLGAVTPEDATMASTLIICARNTRDLVQASGKRVVYALRYTPGDTT